MEGLDIVAFCALPAAYRVLAKWAALDRHRLLLVVMPPAADGERDGTGTTGLAAALPPDQDVLATRRLRTTAAPIVAALKPDIIVAASFPRRIPTEVAGIPRYGAIALHPTWLPRGRGPNPRRRVDGGDLSVAATVHRISPGCNAGPILAFRERRLPEAVAPEDIRAAWSQVLTATLDEGVARAACGDPGERQDGGWATRAAPFTDAARWPSREERAQTIQRRTPLDVLAEPGRAGDTGEDVGVLDVRARRGPSPEAPSGSILPHGGGTSRLPDGVVELAVAR